MDAISHVEGGEFSPEKEKVVIDKLALPTPKSGGEQAASPIGRCRCLPAEVLNDRQWMLFLVLFFGIATQALMLRGGGAARYTSYLNITSSPLYLVHAVRATHHHFAMMRTGIKTKRAGEAFFFLLAGIGSMGTAIGDLTKPFAGGIEIAGLSQVGACSLIFSHILPILLVTTGAIGGFAAAAELQRVQKEMRRFREKIEDRDFQEIAAHLEFLRGPKESAQLDGRARLEEEKRVSYYFSNDARRKALEAKIDQHAFTYTCPVRKIPVAFEVQKEEVYSALFLEVQTLFHAILEKEHDDRGHIKQIAALHQKLKELIEENPSLFADAQEYVEALEREREGVEKFRKEIDEEVSAEMHRNVLNCALSLFIALLSIAGGMLALTRAPHAQITAAALIITASTTGMGAVLFDKFVSEKKFFEMDKWIHTKISSVAK